MDDGKVGGGWRRSRWGKFDYLGREVVVTGKISQANEIQVTGRLVSEPKFVVGLTGVRKSDGRGAIDVGVDGMSSW